MPARESTTYNAYRQAATGAGARLFRNNVGLFRALDSERRVLCGLHPGSGDLIGWRTVTITDADIGRLVAVFLSVEVKLPGRSTQRPTAERQERWRMAVERAGGVGLRCYSVDEMNDALRGTAAPVQGVE